MEQFQEFAAENVYLAGGFTGGFFLGIAWSWTAVYCNLSIIFEIL